MRAANCEEGGSIVRCMLLPESAEERVRVRCYLRVSLPEIFDPPYPMEDGRVITTTESLPKVRERPLSELLT